MCKGRKRLKKANYFFVKQNRGKLEHFRLLRFISVIRNKKLKYLEAKYKNIST